MSKLPVSPAIRRRRAKATKRASILKQLLQLKDRDHDPEATHCTADELLLELIDDKKISAAFHAINKWYA